MRLHKPLVAGVVKALQEIFVEGRKSDHVVPQVLKANPKWGSKDRAFVASNVYEIVRNRLLLEYCLPEVSGTEDYLGAWLTLKGLEVGEHFSHLDAQAIKKASLLAPPDIKYSIPSELHNIGIAQLGLEKWLTEMEAMNGPAKVFLRVNLSKISKEELIESLSAQGFDIGEVPGVDSALELLKKGNVLVSPEYKKGFFEVQDAGSQLIAKFLEPQSGDLVIDACAGAGGKTLHLADLMENKGKILALDVEENKLKELENRASRNGFKIVKTSLVSDAVLLKYEGKADRLLLDVPCSGLGVLKRNPDSKTIVTDSFLTKIQKTQKLILQEYSKMLKSGGAMVYATCSIFPAENEEQVQAFLEANSDFELISQKQILPSESGFDGFYMALLKRK